MSEAITYSVCANCNGLNRFAFDFPSGKSPVCGKCKSLLPVHDGASSLSVSSLETLSSKSPLPVVIDFWAPCRLSGVLSSDEFIKWVSQAAGELPSTHY